MHKCKRISFYLSHKEWVDLNILCVLTDKTLSEFIRRAIHDKLLHTKLNEEDAENILSEP